jgi:hypothetical protein
MSYYVAKTVDVASMMAIDNPALKEKAGIVCAKLARVIAAL